MTKPTLFSPIPLVLFETLLSLVLFAGGQLAAADQRSNIVFILTDDQGYEAYFHQWD